VAAIVFLGTSEFAAIVLRALSGSAFRPALVVTRPDRPRGRGRRLAPPPVAEAAAALGLAVLQPESVNAEDARAAIAEHAPAAVCVCAFGALIREPLLSDHPMLNVHPSLLPRWRGAAPVERAIMAGDERTGVSIMRLTAGLDSGPVCLQEAVAIDPDDTYGTLAPRLAELGGRLLVSALADSPPFAEQDEAGATYAEKITAADRELDPHRAAAELERVVRALTPHIGARLALGDSGFLGVGAARALSGAAGSPGELDLSGERPRLSTADGMLELLRVQPAGGRMMSGEDYLRGHRRSA
jgi:methionyl-tRNA formyltransferase